MPWVLGRVSLGNMKGESFEAECKDSGKAFC